ncbi:hypothetical protein ALT1644_150002 [Alteromonas macleodii]
MRKELMSQPFKKLLCDRYVSLLNCYDLKNTKEVLYAELSNWNSW